MMIRPVCTIRQQERIFQRRRRMVRELGLTGNYDNKGGYFHFDIAEAVRKADAIKKLMQMGWEVEYVDEDGNPTDAESALEMIVYQEEV